MNTPTPAMSARALRDPEFVRECARYADDGNEPSDRDLDLATFVLRGMAGSDHAGGTFYRAVLTRARELMASEAPTHPTLSGDIGGGKAYTVTRYCCSSAHCFGCHERETVGEMGARIRVVQLTTDDRRLAERCVVSHEHYGARIEGDPIDRSTLIALSHRVREAYFAASPEVQAQVRRVLGLSDGD